MAEVTLKPRENVRGFKFSFNSAPQMSLPVAISQIQPLAHSFPGSACGVNFLYAGSGTTHLSSGSDFNTDKSYFILRANG